MKRSKNYNEALSLYDKNKKYSPAEACELAKKTTKVKYDASIRVSFNLNVDPRQADQQIRGATVLPNGTGRSQKILVITQGPNVDIAKNAGYKTIIVREDAVVTGLAVDEAMNRGITIVKE